LTVAGPGQDSLTIDAQQQSRIFDITASSGDFTIAGLTVTGGRTVADGTLEDGPRKRGGAIRSLTTGDLTIDQSTVSGNSTAGSAAEGGGIFTIGAVTLNQSTVSGNSTAGGDAEGGGIFSFGHVMLFQSRVTGNSTTQGGSEGGGIYTHSFGAVTLNQSTVSGNRIMGSGAGEGAGIFSAGNITFAYSTVTDNHATATGGGIWNATDPIVITNSIVAGNTATGGMNDIRPGTGSLDVNYSLIGDNDGTGHDEAPVGSPDMDGNLIGGAGNRVIDPRLGPLASNGGPTQTHALLADSPAIDAGDPNFTPPPDFDQRGDGFASVFDIDIGIARIAMGAVELQALIATWDGDAAEGTVGDAVSWSDASNWTLSGLVDTAPQPGPSGSAIHFQAASTVGTLDLGSDRTVKSLVFAGDYSLSGHTLTVTSGMIDVPAGVTVSIDSDLAGTAGITKTGEGALHIMKTAPDVTIVGGTLVLATTGTVQDLTVGGGATAVLNGAATASVNGNLINNGTLVVGGDLNGSGLVDASDIDLMLAQLALSQEYDARYDLVPDGVVDQLDADDLIMARIGSAYGDANLDGAVDGSDYSQWSLHRFQAGTRWETGDFNGDGATDIRDFNLWNQSKFFSKSIDDVGSGASALRVPRAAGTAVDIETRVADFAIAVVMRERMTRSIDVGQRSFTPRSVPRAMESASHVVKTIDIWFARGADRAFSLLAKRDELAIGDSGDKVETGEESPFNELGSS